MCKGDHCSKLNMQAN